MLFSTRGETGQAVRPGRRLRLPCRRTQDQREENRNSMASTDSRQPARPPDTDAISIGTLKVPIGSLIYLRSFQFLILVGPAGVEPATRRL